VGGSVRFWKLRVQAGATQGWLFDLPPHVHPVEVASQLEGGYHRFEFSAAFDRQRFGNFVRYVPSGGLAVAISSGHIVGEDETLMSVFFDFPSAIPNHSVRVEAVNDALAGKDRGPTGGLRVTYVAR
jgi:hypothetical protein